MKIIRHILALELMLCANWAAAAPLFNQFADGEGASSSATQIADLTAEQATATTAEEIDASSIDNLLSDDYLLANVDQLEELLGTMVLLGNTENLAHYLSLYEQVERRDESLIDWGNALLASKGGDLKKGIALYRKIHSALPELLMVRFQLAIALFQDKQYIAAQSEFEKLRSAQLPEVYLQVVDQYLEAIAKKDAWEFDFFATSVYNKNINNAPPENTQITLPNGSTLTSTNKPQKAVGLKLGLNAEKRWNLYDNWFAKTEINGNGAAYIGDGKNNNELTARLGAGVGYANATSEISLTPYVSRRWFMNKYEDKLPNNTTNTRYQFEPYNYSFGVRLDGNQWLSPNLRYQGALDWSHTRYQAGYENNNGNDYLFSNSLLYMRNPQQYWVLGVNLGRKDVQSDSLSYKRIGASIGWGQEWHKGISTRANLSVARKNYDGVDFLNIKKKNNEWDASLSVWNRNWYFWGITPRLTWQYNRVNSNHAFYNYDGNNVFLEFSKSF